MFSKVCIKNHFQALRFFTDGQTVQPTVRTTYLLIDAPNQRIEKKLTPYLFSTKLTVTKINHVQTKITIDMLLRICLSDEETQQKVLNWPPLRIRKDCINLEEVDYKMVSSCKSVSSFACKKE